MHQTHNIALTQPIADFIVAVDRDGRVHARGLDAGATTELRGRQVLLEQEVDTIASSPSDSAAQQTHSMPADVPVATEQAHTDGKLVVAEEVALGRVSWKTFRLYLHGLSELPLLFISAWFTLLSLTQGLTAFSTYFIGQWGAEYNRKAAEDVPVAWYVPSAHQASTDCSLQRRQVVGSLFISLDSFRRHLWYLHLLLLCRHNTGITKDQYLAGGFCPSLDTAVRSEWPFQSTLVESLVAGSMKRLPVGSLLAVHKTLPQSIQEFHKHCVLLPMSYFRLWFDCWDL